MENFSPTVSAVYFKYNVKECTHEILCILEEIQKENELKITIKAIDSFIL
jgi:hypothetical protein